MSLAGAVQGGLSGYAVGGPWGALAGGLAGALSGDPAQIGNSAANTARFRPFNISTGYGNANFDGTNGTSTLSPQYQALRDQMLGMSSGYFGSASNFDPNAATSNAYNQMLSLSAPYEQQQRASLESRLFNQGNQGSTGGYWQSKALEDSINQSHISQQLNAIGLGQTLLNNQISRGTGLLSGAQGIDQTGTGMLQLGLSGGQMATWGNNTAAQLQYGGNMQGAQNNAAFWNGLLNSGTSYMQGNLFGSGMGMGSYFGNMYDGNNVPGWGSASASYT